MRRPGLRHPGLPTGRPGRGGDSPGGDGLAAHIQVDAQVRYTVLKIWECIPVGHGVFLQNFRKKTSADDDGGSNSPGENTPLLA